MSTRALSRIGEKTRTVMPSGMSRGDMVTGEANPLRALMKTRVEALDPAATPTTSSWMLTVKSPRTLAVAVRRVVTVRRVVRVVAARRVVAVAVARLVVTVALAVVALRLGTVGPTAADTAPPSATTTVEPRSAVPTIAPGGAPTPSVGSPGPDTLHVPSQVGVQVRGSHGGLLGAPRRTSSA